MKNFFLIILFITSLNFSNNLFAGEPYFIDFSKVLNQSIAGKEAQKYLRNKLQSEDKKFLQKDNALRDEEKKLVAKKKLISNEEYKVEVKKLRKKVADLQIEKRKTIQDVANLRKEGRKKLLAALTPIIKEYMEKNKIRMVIDKKSMLLADENLDITGDIIKILNTKLKSIKLN